MVNKDIYCILLVGILKVIFTIAECSLSWCLFIVVFCSITRCLDWSLFMIICTYWVQWVVTSIRLNLRLYVCICLCVVRQMNFFVFSFWQHFHLMMTAEYGFPAWSVYGFFAVVTVCMGLMLGMVSWEDCGVEKVNLGQVGFNKPLKLFPVL